MRTLDLKLLRDLRRMWAQALAIALVMASGVATFVLASGAYHSLDATRSAYYLRYRFADIFAEVRRAPKSVVEQVLAIPGVATAEPRITHLALLDVEGLLEPATARAVSIPDLSEPRLNLLHLREGRLPERERIDEVTVNEGFAKAHRMHVGSTFKALLNGKKRELKVVGIALSPEFIYALGPGDLMPDDRRFAVLWMSEKALAGLFDLDGAFNEITLRLLPGASEAEVLKQLDDLLARYGGTRAYSRKDQLSHAFLDAELMQLEALRRVMPPIFLLVSAFLINITLSRTIALEREQIGLLKALGYGPLPIAMHYIKMVLAITVVGIGIGFIAGAWLGQGLTRLYGDFFHFPFLIFRHDADIYAIATLISVAAAVAGAIKAVREVLALAPAVAMQPPAPARYHRLFRHPRRWSALLSQITVMAFRHMVQKPLRAVATSLGIAMAVGLLVTALLSFDSVERMIEIAFFRTDRQHATLTFTDEKHTSALQAVERLPGVLRAEPYRSVAVRLRKEHRSRQLSIVGKPQDMDLSRVLDLDDLPVRLPPSGLVINERVAQLLGVQTGDVLQVEILEERRGIQEIAVADVIKGYFGLTAFMDLAALDRLMYGPRLSGVHIAYDSRQEANLFAAIKSTPSIGSIGLQRHALARFRETIAQNINYSVTIYVTLAVIIAFGVVYNSARIQLSEHARELASLRVLGFTRGEASRVLLTELTLLTLIAIPLGWIVGYGFGWLLIQAFSSDLYRIIEPMPPAFLDVRTTRELEAQLEAAKAAVALAEAEINQAAAELEFAQNELARASALIRSKTISERALERARIDVDTRKASLARAKASLEVRKRELESAQARLIPPEEAWKGEVPTGCCVTVRAPVSGRVLKVIQESERVIAAGTPLIEVGDPANLELVVELLSADAVKVREGAPATIEGWGGAPLKAKVTRVEPSGFTKVSALGIEEQRVRTILKLDNVGTVADKLGHDFRVFVKISIYQASDALRVPISALFRRREQWTVYIVERGRAHAVPVEVGQRNTSFAELLKGLPVGTVVILHPSDRVVDGVRVQPVRSDQ